MQRHVDTAVSPFWVVLKCPCRRWSRPNTGLCPTYALSVHSNA